MKKSFYYFVCFVFIFSGIFYLVNEYITVLNTADSISAYYTHTISDLAVPYKVSTFSNFYILLKTTFFIVGPVFFLCYNFLFQNKIEKVNFLCFLLSFFVCVGVIMVGAFYTNGEHHTLHIIGTVITFASANILILLTGLYYNKKEDRKFKKFCVFLSFVGIFCGLALIFPIPKVVMPIVERFTIYPLIIFEIISGFKFIQQRNDFSNYVIEIK